MFKKIKEFFVGKPASERHPLDAVTTSNVSAPYKVPEPAATTPIPLVVEAPAVVEAAPVTDQLAVVNAAEGSAVTAPVKAPRKPRAPKAATAVKEKAPAKAKAPKLTVVKAEKKPRSKKA
jgi:hypothetical protein